jgi:transcriptional regulator with XRE-family HTH domain
MGLNRMSGKKDKKLSIENVAEAAGVNYVYTQRILAGSTKYPKETQDKVFKAAEKIGYVKTHHPKQHFNDKLTQDKADLVVEGILQNKSLESIAADTGLSTATAFKLIRGVKVPTDYPDNEDDWRKDVTGFLEVAIWKGTKRLAESSINLIDDRGLPIAVAVLTDKLSVIKGQPTSIHLSMTASVNHRDLMADLRDRNTITVNDEQTPDVV